MLARTKYLIPVLLTLVVPSAADAATVQVNGGPSGINNAACGVAPQAPCKTIQLGAARAQSAPYDTTADQIVVAPGTYAEVVSVVGKGDAIVGSGSCDQQASCTIIKPAAGDTDAVVFTPNADGGSISGVRIEADTVTSRTGLHMQADDPTVRNVAVDMTGAPDTEKNALRLTGAGNAVVDRVSIISQGEAAGIYPLGPMTSFTLTDSSVYVEDSNALFLGSVGSATVRRSTLREGQTPEVNEGSVVAGTTPGHVRIESSLVTGGFVGVRVGSPLDVVGSTVDPDVPGISDRSAVATDEADAGELSTVRDSILIGTLYTANNGQPLSCSTSDVDVVAGTNAPSCVEGTAGNTRNAPEALFADVANRDYRLKVGSPAVDTGSDTALDPAETTDIAGAARVLDGNQDCVARRDRGAYELTGFAAACPQGQQGGSGGGTTPPPDTKKPTLARLAAGPTKLRFRLSEAAKVSVRIDRKGKKGRRTVYKKVGAFTVKKAKAGANSLKVPAKLAKALKAKPATYRVTLVATDAAGNRSKQARKSFTVKPAKKKKRG